jgi:hypothetical protein
MSTNNKLLQEVYSGLLCELSLYDYKIAHEAKTRVLLVHKLIPVTATTTCFM